VDVASLAQIAPYLQSMPLSESPGYFGSNLILVGGKAAIDLSALGAGNQGFPYAAIQTFVASPVAASVQGAYAPSVVPGFEFAGFSGPGYLSTTLTQPEASEFGRALALIESLLGVRAVSVRLGFGVARASPSCDG
jgi:hypothetical protein